MENIDLDIVRGDDDGWSFELLEDDESQSDLPGFGFNWWINQRKGKWIN